MARRPDLPSRISQHTPKRETATITTQPRATRQVAANRVDVRGWLGGIRFSGFMAIMLGLVVLAVFVLVPSVGTYLDQRQRIASLQESVALTQAEVDALQEERDRYDDPNFIASQARERLYYVKPGEVVYLVDNDLDANILPLQHGPVSKDVEKTNVNWMSSMLISVTEAGLARSGSTEGTAPVEPEPVPTPGEQTETPTH